MKLSEDQEVVEALKFILEDYNYLEYDEVGSRNENYLKVKVTHRDAERDRSVVLRIIRALEKATNRRFRDTPTLYPHHKGWMFFTIRPPINLQSE